MRETTAPCDPSFTFFMLMPIDNRLMPRRDALLARYVSQATPGIR